MAKKKQRSEEYGRKEAAEIKRLREGLRLIECEPINAEYMARNILDGKPAYYDTMIKVGCGDTAPNCEVRGDAPQAQRPA